MAQIYWNIQICENIMFIWNKYIFKTYVFPKCLPISRVYFLYSMIKGRDLRPTAAHPYPHIWDVTPPPPQGSTYTIRIKLCMVLVGKFWKSSTVQCWRYQEMGVNIGKLVTLIHVLIWKPRLTRKICTYIYAPTFAPWRSECVCEKHQITDLLRHFPTGKQKEIERRPNFPLWYSIENWTTGGETKTKNMSHFQYSCDGLI